MTPKANHVLRERARAESVALQSQFLPRKLSWGILELVQVHHQHSSTAPSRARRHFPNDRPHLSGSLCADFKRRFERKSDKFRGKLLSGRHAKLHKVPRGPPNLRTLKKINNLPGRNLPVQWISHLVQWPRTV